MVTSVVDAGTPAPERGPRPATVLTAAILQGVSVLVLLGIVALGWYARAQHNGLAEQAAGLVRTEPAELAAEYSSSLVMAIVVTVLAGGPAIWLAATLRPMLHGANVARILAAVAAFGIPGLGLLMVLGSCLTGFLFLGFLASAPIEGDPGGGGDFPDSVDLPGSSPFQDKLWDLEGAGPTVSDVLPLLAMLVMGLLAAVAVLLVVPATNRWFSPQRAAQPAGRPYPVYYPVYVPVAPYAAAPYPGPVAPSPFPAPPVPPVPPVLPVPPVPLAPPVPPTAVIPPASPPEDAE